MRGGADVVVVGAGAAGLAAARQLSAAGLEVRVVEARERAGGRIFTVRDERFELPVELGAEFVHGRPRELMELVRERGLTMCAVGGEPWRLEAGALESDRDLGPEVEEILAHLEADSPADRSFAQFLDDRPGGRHLARARQRAAVYVGGFHAARLERIGVHGLARATKALAFQAPSHRLLGGYDHVVEALASRLPTEALLLGRVVEEISWHPGGVELVVRRRGGPSRELFRARAVVVTVPLGVLLAGPGEEGAIRFTPPLGDRFRAGGVEPGLATRLVLRFAAPVWEPLLDGLGFLRTPAGAFPIWWTPEPVKAPMLVGWAGGAAAETLTGEGPRELVRRALDELAVVLGRPRSELSRALTGFWSHDWQRDPYARGAYSHVVPSGLEGQERMRSPLAATLFFAGEAMDTEGRIGTVHGALASGERAADELLVALGQKPAVQPVNA